MSENTVTATRQPASVETGTRNDLRLRRGCECGQRNPGGRQCGPCKKKPASQQHRSGSELLLSADVQPPAISEESAGPGLDLSNVPTSTSPPAAQQPAAETVQEEASSHDVAPVSGATTQPSALVVDDAATDLGAGQLHRTDFLNQLETAVRAEAAAALAGTEQSTTGLPYLDYWFAYYRRQSNTQIESAVHRYAPETRTSETAAEYISLVASRVRQGVERWVATGEVTGLPTVASDSIATGSEHKRGASVQLKARGGTPRPADDPTALAAELGTGTPLEGGLRNRMQGVFGQSFHHVRTHTDGTARTLADEQNARAFTVGHHVAFGSGEYRPGTVVGDAIIAHELAHVVQQKGARTPEGPASAGGARYAALEKDADQAATGALTRLWGGQAQEAGTGRPGGVAAQLRSGLRLQRCGKKSTPAATNAATLTYTSVPNSFGQAGPTEDQCGGFEWAVRWGLQGADNTTNGFVVQKLTFDLRKERCAGGRDDFSKTYWEGWQVRNGNIFVGTSSSPHNADTFRVPPSPDEKGTNFEEGHARFIPNYTDPLSWGTVPEAGSLPATTTQPTGWSDAGTIHRWMRNTFDCCATPHTQTFTHQG